jgi:hypothetical protein
MDVAWHDLWTHAIWRTVIVPIVRPVVEKMEKALR